MLELQSFLGIFVFIGIAYVFSNNRKMISWKIVVSGLALQLILALLVLGVPKFGFNGPLRFIFGAANEGILKLLSFTNRGSEFLLGNLIDPQKSGFILVFQVLPIIIFLSSLMTILYHLGVMQKVVNGFAFIMQKVLKLSGAESLAAAANVFVGQTEAPLVIRPYLKNMTSSELFSLMVGGMATIAGSVMAAYVGLLKDVIPDIGGHLLTASLLSAPAALLVAKIMVPETKTPETLGQLPKEKVLGHANLIDAAASGASDGLKLAANVAAMLLAFVALIAMVDSLFIFLGDQFYIALDYSLNTLAQWNNSGVASDGSLPFNYSQTLPQFSLAWILSWVFTPIAFFIGIPLSDLGLAGTLIGKKIVFNEFIAYLDLASLNDQLQPRSSLILSYALCGFANFSSIAIQIGGIGPLIPERRKELAEFGLRSVIGGSLAAFLTACMASILI